MCTWRLICDSRRFQLCVSYVGHSNNSHMSHGLQWFHPHVCSWLPNNCRPSSLFVSQLDANGSGRKSNGWCVNSNKPMSLTLLPCPGNSLLETPSACIMAPPPLLFPPSQPPSSWDRGTDKAKCKRRMGVRLHIRRFTDRAKIKKQPGSMRCTFDSTCIHFSAFLAPGGRLSPRTHWTVLSLSHG